MQQVIGPLEGPPGDQIDDFVLEAESAGEVRVDGPGQDAEGELGRGHDRRVVRLVVKGEHLLAALGGALQVMTSLMTLLMTLVVAEGQIGQIGPQAERQLRPMETLAALAITRGLEV